MKIERIELISVILSESERVKLVDELINYTNSENCPMAKDLGRRLMRSE